MLSPGTLRNNTLPTEQALENSRVGRPICRVCSNIKAAGIFHNSIKINYKGSMAQLRQRAFLEAFPRILRSVMFVLLIPLHQSHESTWR
jgi:hypothetical protein